MYENNLNAVFTFSEAPSNYRGYQHLWKPSDQDQY